MSVLTTPPLAGTGRQSGRRRPVPALDPRTTMGLLLLVSLAVLSPQGTEWLWAGLALSTGLMASIRAWRYVAAYLVLVGAGLLIAEVVPLLARHVLLGIAGIVASYLVRLAVVATMAAYLVRTTRPADLMAALRSVRVPRAVAVSLAVMIRFIPTVITEARAVGDAMRLRGLNLGPLGLLRSPVASLEYFVVPLMASSLRVAEDLSASALIRGLGASVRPTSIRPPRFTMADTAAWAAAAVLAAATLAVRWPA